ncbi:ATP-dependent DNA ligase [Cyathus striatus]|nr:ATP-dependent DNA ligase [Cyathus striatus]
MPKSSKPAPPQQSSLTDMWGGSKRQIQSTSASNAKEVATNVDMNEEKQIESSKRKERTSPAKSPKLKKRRIVHSDDEGDASAANFVPVSTPIVPSPPSGSSSKRPLSLRSPKKKEKKAAIVEASSAEDDAASTGYAEDSAVQEEDLDGMIDEDEMEIDSSAVSKTAEAALSKKSEVDVKGGWKTGQPVPYAALTKTFSLIESTTKRLEKNAYLTSFLLLVIQRSAKDDYKSLLQAVYLCINRLSPDYIGLELGIGESLLIKAIAESTGRSIAVIKGDLKKEGDLGLVAMISKNSQKTLFKPKPLTIPFVFSNLREIALTSGHASQSKKVSIITKLLAACQDFEAKYIIRSLEGKLRIGNAEKSVLVALAHAIVLAEKERVGKKWNNEQLTTKLELATSIMKSVYSELPTYDMVIPALLESGIDNLKEKCKLTPGVPLKPMLAKPTKAIGEVLDRFENKRFTCEYKYDGERAQVHKLDDGTVSVFSRNSEDMSKKYPDLVDQLPKSFVLDAEAELSKRKRKDVKVEDIQVRVSLFAFDLLYLNGEVASASLELFWMNTNDVLASVTKVLEERRALLREHFTVVPGEFDFAKSSDGETTDEIQSFLEESVKDGCEGLMLYEPSRRSVNWLKLKKDYLAGVGDSLDLVVVGGYYGKGKRTNVYGAFLLACYDSDSEVYQTICKIGTGFRAKPDIWFEPKVVWEVLAADLSLSPVYTAAQGLIEERGISLRFPRFIRVRDDKSADDATGPEQAIAEMYERQALAQSSGKKGGGDGDDFW